MREIWKTFREYLPVIIRLWWAVGAFLLFDAYSVLAVATKKWAPSSEWTHMIQMPSLWAIAVFVLLALIWVQFLTLHSLRKQRDELKKITDYEAAIDGLAELFDDGTNRILNGPVSSETEYGAWKERWDQWRLSVEKYLKEHFGRREELMFRNSVLYTTYNLAGINDAHISDRSQVVRKLEILRNTMLRHSDRASKWRFKLQ